ncbi:hypothetical protein [Duganella vulcania]|uniref:Uncharacterized protein n=1 Tax=Duganella vulcania TaxID=2692166 RepID=A0A845GGN9_9BURK|nr:hypothetical protein [Duganella vulcania]MYM92416.1 hypothetical protein [Duganella vulcania]
MNITREHFDGDRLSAMDEIAILVLAIQALRASGEAFEHTEDLEKERTFDTAAPVLKFLEATASSLLKAICQGKTKRALLLAKTRSQSAVTLMALLPSVEALAKQEIAIYKDKDTGGKHVGTSVRDLVLEPLKAMLSVWTVNHV